MPQTIKKARQGRNSASRLAALLIGVALAYAFIAALLCVAAAALVGGAR